MPQGIELLKEVHAARVPDGAFALWWLGQHGFLIKAGGLIISLDAFLSPHPRRQVPPLFSPQDAFGIDLFIGTHDHSDHIDRGVWPLLAQSAPQARFAVPGLLVEKVSSELGIPLARFIALDEGQSVDLGGLSISAVAAAHEFLDRDAASGRYPHLGVVLETAGHSLYHSGDSCVYEGLETKLKKWNLDGVLLPINGRSAAQLKSGIIGNMTYQEAVDLAGNVGARCAVPTHFDMFARNSGDPEAFLEYLAVKYPGVKGVFPRHGERFDIPNA